MSAEEITYIVEKRVAWITINRPEKMNALTPDHMTEDLPAVWQRYKADDSADVAVVTGAGDKAFCSGVDVRAVAEQQARGEDSAKKASRSYLLSPLANEVWKPVIAAVNGACAGIAMNLVADCDLVVASETAYFMDARTSNGMMSAMGSIELTRVMPMHEALRLVMLGRHGRLTAQRAHQIGFVNELAAPAALRAAVQKLAESLMENAPMALRLTKMALWQGLEHNRRGALDNARAIMSANPTTADVKEGSLAFLQKRKPAWTLR